MTTPQDKRAAAIKAMERHDISQRRACRLVSVDPKTVSRTKVPDNSDIRAKMRAIAEQRRRFGYRRIGLMLEREGIMMNHKKLRRIYGEEGLSVKRRRGRKRALGTRAPMLEPSGPSVRWSLDFVSDSFGDGRRFRILAVIDDFTRECLALVADTSLSGARVARELDRIIRLYGKPQMIVSDNGTEFVSRAMLEWQNSTGVSWHYIALGKPQQNGFGPELQRQAPRRVVERRSVRQLGPCKTGPQSLATRLQQCAAPQWNRRACARCAPYALAMWKHRSRRASQTPNLAVSTIRTLIKKEGT